MRSEEKWVVAEIKTSTNVSKYYCIGDILYKSHDTKCYVSDRMNTHFGNDSGLPIGYVNKDVELVPFDIYHSPLYKIMREDNEV